MVNSNRIVAGFFVAITASGTAQQAAAQTGACCVAGGGIIFCSDESEKECASLGGVYHGDGTLCDPFPCTIGQGPLGACCLPSSCFESTESECNGTWLGPGTSCFPYPCEVPAAGACCLKDVNFCFQTDEVQCEIFKGTFHKGETCIDIGCGDGGGNKDVGACCLLGPFGVSCLVTTEESCAGSGGEFQGIDSTCDPVPCDQGTGPIGACCITGGGLILCSELHESHCAQLGGSFQGPDTTCDPNPCIPPGDGNGDGRVDVADLLLAIGSWGPCPPPAVGDCPSDSNDDEIVDIADVLFVLLNWS